MTITFNHISLQHVLNIIPPSCLFLVCLRENIILLGTSLVCTKLKGERMECNIGQVTFIEQIGECIIIYFGRPCDEFAERVWPIKISDGARVTLFNMGLVSCDVNQSFLILLFE